MNKNTKKALIKRECKQFGDLLTQFASEFVVKAKNEVQLDFIHGEFMTGIKNIVDEFNKRNENKDDTVKYIADTINTHESIIRYLESKQDQIDLIPCTIHDLYEQVFNNSISEFDYSVDIVVERLNGIATVSQLSKEFIKTTEKVDEYVIEMIGEYSLEILADINNKIYEITGGFQYEYKNVIDYLVTHMIYEEDVKTTKITDRKQLQQMARNNGFEFKSQCGSHRKYENSNGDIVVIPMHSYDIGKGLSHKIQKQILQ